MQKILAIDDTSDNLISMKAIINHAFPGFVVFTAKNGLEGIELALIQNPDVILLDIIMPGMDGFEVCQCLKKDERVRDIPIVFLTALKGNKEHRIKALEAGAEGFLSKPIDETELTAQIKAMIKIKAANEQVSNEEKRMKRLVAEQTEALEKELTERKRAEQELFETKENFRQIVERANDIFYRQNIQTGKFEYVSPKIYDVLGFTVEKFLDLNLEDQNKGIHPDDRPNLVNFVIDLIKADDHNQKFIEREFRLRNKQGEYLWMHGNYTLLRDYNNIPQQIIGSLTDITVRKLAEDALRYNNERLELAMKSANMSWWEIDMTSGNVVFEKRKTEMLGYLPEKFKHYKNFMDLVHPNDYERTMDAMRSHLNGSVDKYEIEYRIKNASGVYNWFYDIGSVIKRDAQGKPLTVAGLVLNITERKQAEEAFRESQSLYYSFIEQLPNAVFRKDREGRYILVNSQFCKLKGQKKEDLIGAKPMEVTSDEISLYEIQGEASKYASLGEDIHELILQTGKCYEQEEKYTSASEDSIYMHSMRMPVIDSSGAIIGTQGIMFDITKIKKVEAELHEKEVQYRNLANSGLALIWTAETNKLCNYFNEPWLKFTGRTLEQELGNGWAEGVHPDDFDKCINTYITAFEKHEAFEMEYRLHHVSGEYRWLQDMGTPNYNSEGEFIGYIGHCFDITDRKKLEIELVTAKEKAEKSEQEIILKNNELIDKNKFIQTVLDNLPIGISLNKIDEGEATYMNKKFQEIYGWSSEEITSISTFFEHVYPDVEYRNTLIERTMTDIQSGDPTRMHWENIFVTRKDGSTRVVNSVNIPLTEQNTMVSTVTDITDLHKSQNDLLIAKEKAEESDQLKSAFLANMSHEIRTPLNSIIGFSELMTDPGFDGTQQYEFARIINTSGNNLLAIISDIMDISKIEAGQLILDESIFSVQQLVRGIQREYSFKAAEKGIELRIDSLNPDEEIFINSDQNKLKQVLINFVSNAIKFTDRDFIEIGIRDKGDSVYLQVKDCGIGIPKEYHDKIFERFRQIESSNSRKYGGNGLGLAISKSLVEVLGGEIGIESILGEGSTFYFTIPKGLKN